MKNRLAQLIAVVSKIDRSRIQLAWFTFIVLGAIIMRSPSDGGVGPF